MIFRSIYDRLYGEPIYDPGTLLRKNISLIALGASTLVAGAVSAFGPSYEAEWHGYRDDLQSSFDSVRTDSEIGAACIRAIESLPDVNGPSLEEKHALRTDCGENAALDYTRYIVSKNALDRVSRRDSFWQYLDRGLLGASALGVVVAGAAITLGTAGRQRQRLRREARVTNDERGSAKLRRYKPQRLIS